MIVILIISLARPTESATTPGTCLPTAKGGTGCFDIEFLNKIYPIGAIYTSTSDVNPSTYLGGVWEEFGGGRTLVGVGANEANTTTAYGTIAAGSINLATPEELGGESGHQLINNELPKLGGGINFHYGGSNAATEVSGTIAPNGYTNISSVYGSHSLYKTTYAAGAATSYHEWTFQFGDNQAHNNMQPFVTVFFWKRIS